MLTVQPHTCVQAQRMCAGTLAARHRPHASNHLSCWTELLHAKMADNARALLLCCFDSMVVAMPFH